MVEAKGDTDVMFAGGDVAEAEEPDHERVGEGKLSSANGGKHAEQGVFAGGGVDVDAVAHEPAENLRFRVHHGSLAIVGGGGAGGKKEVWVAKMNRGRDFLVRVFARFIPG